MLALRGLAIPHDREALAGRLPPPKRWPRVAVRECPSPMERRTLFQQSFHKGFIGRNLQTELDELALEGDLI